MKENKASVVEISDKEYQETETKKIERYTDTLISNFEKDGSIPNWNNYNAVSKFKSVRRAIRRGHVDLFTGIIYPSRPFNNRKSTKGRKINNLKKQIYGQLKSRAKKG